MAQELSIPPKGLLLVTHEPNSVNTAPGPHIRGSTLRAFSVGEKEVDLILPGTARLVTSSMFLLSSVDMCFIALHLLVLSGFGCS